jgi:Flp pilus assembly protein TadG
VELVEFVLIAPILLLLVFGVVEFGFVFNDHIEIRSAAREGGRLAVVDNGCANGACITTATAQRDALIATTRTKAQGLANSTSIRVSISCSNTGGCPSSTVGTDTVTVCLNYTVTSVTGLLAPVVNNLVLRASATMRVEQVPSYAAGTDTGGPGAATCP